MPKCSYNFNGEHVTGNTPEQCAKLAARFQKSKEKMQREFDSISGRSRNNKKETPKPNKKKETPKPNKKKAPSKIKKKATQLITNFKNRRAVAKKRKAVQNSRKKGLDRNAIN